jgi:hypothetical protein
MSINGIIGEQADYGELTVAIFNEGEGTFRVHIMDGSVLSSVQ